MNGAWWYPGCPGGLDPTEAIFASDCPSRRNFCVSFAKTCVPVFERKLFLAFWGFYHVKSTRKPATTVLFKGRKRAGDGPRVSGRRWPRPEEAPRRFYKGVEILRRRITSGFFSSSTKEGFIETPKRRRRSLRPLISCRISVKGSRQWVTRGDCFLPVFSPEFFFNFFSGTNQKNRPGKFPVLHHQFFPENISQSISRTAQNVSLI